MKVFRKIADPLKYTVVGHDGPRPLTPSIGNTFLQASLPVKAGDVLGNNSKSPVDNGSYFTVPGDSPVFLNPGLADGPAGTFAVEAAEVRLNFSAVLEPDCDQDAPRSWPSWKLIRRLVERPGSSRSSKARRRDRWGRQAALSGSISPR